MGTIVDECSIIKKEGLSSVLTLRSNGSSTDPSRPPKDIETYKNKLASVIDSCNPEIITVEYKETSDLFYAGTAKEYLEQLKAAVEVSHQMGIKCSNGGMESDFIALLYYSNLVESGDLNNAVIFAQKAFNKIQRSAFQSHMNQNRLKKILDKGKSFLEIYARSGIDYLNVHWSIEDPVAFEMIVEFLKLKVGIPLISTEIKVPQNSTKVQDLMKTVSKLKFACAIWYFSVEGQYAEEIDKLSGKDSVSRKYRNFIKQRYSKTLILWGNWLLSIFFVKYMMKLISNIFVKIKRKWLRKKKIILKGF